jgi:hypothetical protein
MSFFKKLFSRKSDLELAREFLISKNFQKAVNITELEGIPCSKNIMMQAMKELIAENKVNGRLVGEKGWFLPVDKTFFDKYFNEINSSPLEIEKITKDFNLNKKRTIIALKEEARNRQKLNDWIIDDENYKIFNEKYLEKKWKELINTKDFIEDEIFYNDLINELPHKEVLEPLVEIWISSEKSPVVKHSSGRVYLRSELKELIIEDVKNMWNDGKNEIRFITIADTYGISTTDAGNIILQMVNSNQLEDVTVYAADELIKRRSVH